MILKQSLRSTQSGFNSNDSCVNWLISIGHSIFSAFNANHSLEVCSVYLNVPKVF